MSNVEKKMESIVKRSRRIRYKVKRAGRLRLSVFRSNRNIFAQIIDDLKGETVVSASSMDKGFRRKPGDPFNKDTARAVGKRIAERAKEKNISKVVFDRGPYLYHGKVKALADGAREAGLDF
jgi:large subunit ribosomal protein L18